MSDVRILTKAAYGIHAADQIGMVAVPLIATMVLGASPQVLGALVAAQTMAHLVVSLPAGILVDRVENRRLVVASTLLVMAGFVIATFAVLAKTAALLGLGVFISGCGTVLFALSALSILPKIVATTELAPANARFEFPRSVASLFLPLGIGVLASASTIVWVFPLGIACAVAACWVVRGMQPAPVNKTQSRVSQSTQIWATVSYVLRNDLLRPIGLCAVFWNLAFAALLVTLVVFVADELRTDAGVFGIALAAFGAGAIAGTWISRTRRRFLPPWFVLIFGPASSALAAVALLFLSPAVSIGWLYAIFFVLGFGPSMWLVAQNSVRQLVTPSEILGRVNAVIQTTIYGVRPLGAMLAGLLVASYGSRAGLGVVAVLFGLSTVAILFSQLNRLRSYSDIRAVPLGE